MDHVPARELVTPSGALVRDLPPDRRGPAMMGLVRSLRGSYELQGGLCPPWLEELCERWAPADDAPPP